MIVVVLGIPLSTTATTRGTTSTATLLLLADEHDLKTDLL
jgi:hypothetical protein